MASGGPVTGEEPAPYMDPDGTWHNLKPIARLTVSGPDQEPRRYTDTAFGSGWFVAKTPATPSATAAGGADAGESGGKGAAGAAPRDGSARADAVGSGASRGNGQAVDATAGDVARGGDGRTGKGAASADGDRAAEFAHADAHRAAGSPRADAGQAPASPRTEPGQGAGIPRTDGQQTAENPQTDGGRDAGVPRADGDRDAGVPRADGDRAADPPRQANDLGKHLPLSAADLDAIRWRLDGGTLREVVDDRDALRELGERLDGPLTDEADNIVKAGLLSVRAEVYRLLGELGMAAAASRLALAHAESAQDEQSMVIAQAELAHVLRLRGDWREADRLFQRAVDSEVPAAVLSVVHENAGRSAFDQGRHMEALDHFARAIRLGAADDTDLVERIGVCLEAVYIHVLRDGWGPYPRRAEEIRTPLGGRGAADPSGPPAGETQPATESQTAEGQAAERQAAERQTAERQAAERQTAERQAAERQTAERQAAASDALDERTAEQPIIGER
ncbi:hypothetical protein [Actinoplanes teichomyceticus]|uniref:hypothetical protein n=1 Tax=Actinoplanes teichomyceticus TaxID=1867 RepID=UPI0011EAC411|nr:hypothetical protein [Actinoplanes teichomyceticus]